MPKTKLGRNTVGQYTAKKLEETKQKMAMYGITQEEVAEYIGKSRQTVNNQLNGKTQLSIVVLFAVDMLTDARAKANG